MVVEYSKTTRENYSPDTEHLFFVTQVLTQVFVLMTPRLST